MSSTSLFVVGVAALLVTHLLAALYLPVEDSDEIYNFVEPIHFLLYGSGKQTWENCNFFGLRSWVFALLYAAPAYVGAKLLPVTLAMKRILPLFSSASGVDTLSAASNLVPQPLGEVRSIDIYFFLRVVYGQCSAVSQLFFVACLRVAYPHSSIALTALYLLATSAAVPHAGVSALPSSFVMDAFFIAFGCWLCSHRSRWYAIVSVAVVVVSAVVGWPFAGLLAMPMLLDYLYRFPALLLLSGTLFTLTVGFAEHVVDSIFYCTPTLSTWNIILYNVLGGGSASLYGTEPWYFFDLNLLLQFRFVFLLALLCPLVLLVDPRLPAGYLQRTLTPLRLAPKKKCHQPFTASYAVHSRGLELLFASPFFLWFGFWHLVPHKEDRFMAPAYPSLVYAAALTASRLCCRSAKHEAAEIEVAHMTSTGFLPPVSEEGGRRAAASSQTKRYAPPISTASAASQKVLSEYGRYRCWLLRVGLVLLIGLSGALSCSRGYALYYFYGAPQRLMTAAYPTLQHAAPSNVTVCVGREWYRFPSSFFLPASHTFGFLRSDAFGGSLPLDFEPAKGLLAAGEESGHWVQRLPKACSCRSMFVNADNFPFDEQYTPRSQCFAVLDSFPLPSWAEERHQSTSLAIRHRRLEEEAEVKEFTKSLVSSPHQYRLLDSSRTPSWCRVLYYPFGVTESCAAWRGVVLRAKEGDEDPKATS